MAVTRAAVNQLPPLINRQVEGVLPLALQCLQAQGPFQFQLFRRQMGCCHHPVEQGHQLLGVFGGAAQTDQQSVFMGVTAQARASPLHQIRQLTMVERSAATAEGGRQKLMGTTLADAVRGTAPGQQQFRRHHAGGGDPINDQVRDGHQRCPAGVAIRLQARLGCSNGIRSSDRRSSVQACRCCSGCSSSCGRFHSIWLAAWAAT